jgi:hypothetical protein
MLSQGLEPCTWPYMVPFQFVLRGPHVDPHLSKSMQPGIYTVPGIYITVPREWLDIDIPFVPNVTGTFLNAPSGALFLLTADHCFSDKKSIDNFQYW